MVLYVTAELSWKRLPTERRRNGRYVVPRTQIRILLREMLFTASI